MPKLSVVMIVKNEAHCLADCLRSVQGLADELVIGDTGSDDDTPELARRWGAQVFSVPWENDFAAARNRVLAAAHGDWLLHLDADEVVDARGAQLIRSLLDSTCDAVEVTLANYSDDPRAWRWMPAEPGSPYARGFSGYIAVPLLRLFRNHRGFEYREPVHENITESVLERGGVIRHAPEIVIHHYGYGSQGQNAEAKARLYLEIGKAKAARRPADAKAWHDLAEQLLACGDATQAEAACRRALEIDPLHLGAATSLANMLLNRGDLDEARRVLGALEQAGLAAPHVVTALAAIACKQGRIDEACHRLDAVLRVAPTAIMARLYAARASDLRGDFEAARAHLDAALATAPNLAEVQERATAHALRREAESLFQRDQARSALPMLVEALRLDSEDPLTQNDLGVVLAALGEIARARECFERALRLAPSLNEARENLAALGVF